MEAQFFCNLNEVQPFNHMKGNDRGTNFRGIAFSLVPVALGRHGWLRLPSAQILGVTESDRGFDRMWKLGDTQ